VFRHSLPLRLNLISLSFALVVTALLVTLGAVLLYQQQQDQSMHTAKDSARNLGERAERLMQMGLPLADLMGFEEQCLDVLPGNASLRSAMVFDAKLAGLYSSLGGTPRWPTQISTDTASKDDGWVVHPIRLEGQATAGWVVVFINSQHVMAETLEQVSWFVGLAGLLLVVGLILQQALFWRSVGRPLAELVKAADQVDIDETDALPVPRSDDDIGRVHAAMRRLVDRLHQAQQKLVQDNMRLESMVQERTQRLNEANAALKRDLKRREALESELRRLANTDSLTGLASRGFFQSHGQTRLEAARRNQYPIAILMIDLDRFKAINDTHGHAVGDQVLCMAAHRIRQMARGSDVLARYGGDEFVMLCESGQGADDLETLGKRLVELFEAPLLIESLRLSIGVSIGAASFPDHGSDLGSLMSAADAAMYVAKQRGGGFCKAPVGWTPHLVGAVSGT
jgi:diguanylate cyclase (GGDEF)-like protein